MVTEWIRVFVSEIHEIVEGTNVAVGWLVPTGKLARREGEIGWWNGCHSWRLGSKSTDVSERNYKGGFDTVSSQFSQSGTDRSPDANVRALPSPSPSSDSQFESVEFSSKSLKSR